MNCEEADPPGGTVSIEPGTRMPWGYVEFVWSMFLTMKFLIGSRLAAVTCFENVTRMGSASSIGSAAVPVWPLIGAIVKTAGGTGSGPKELPDRKSVLSAGWGEKGGTTIGMELTAGPAGWAVCPPKENPLPAGMM